MNARLELDPKEILQAVRQHVSNQGWNVSDAALVVVRGDEGQKVPDQVRAVLQVQPRAQDNGSFYQERGGPDDR